jgi:hypothetical protein
LDRLEQRQQQMLLNFVWKNLTRNQATELAAILGEIAEVYRSLTTQKVANTISKAGTGI